ncbi:MAG TPA: hypothetical protein VMV69_16420 [Pirellulales bacterium]|nr:hypothetical protein [Pirellulales bacterium]
MSRNARPVSRRRLLLFTQYVRRFRDTGAIVPGSRWLAKALARYVGCERGPRSVLTLRSLARYAQAVGMQLTFRLTAATDNESKTTRS